MTRNKELSQSYLFVFLLILSCQPRVDAQISATGLLCSVVVGGTLALADRAMDKTLGIIVKIFPPAIIITFMVQKKLSDIEYPLAHKVNFFLYMNINGYHPKNNALFAFIAALTLSYNKVFQRNKHPLTRDYFYYYFYGIHFT